MTHQRQGCVLSNAHEELPSWKTCSSYIPLHGLVVIVWLLSSLNTSHA